jgi:hypothetical protein
MAMSEERLGHRSSSITLSSQDGQLQTVGVIAQFPVKRPFESERDF